MTAKNQKTLIFFKMRENVVLYHQIQNKKYMHNKIKQYQI